MNMKQNAALEMFEYLKEHLIPLAKDKGDKVYESDTTVQIARPENKSVWDCEKEVKQLLSKIGAYARCRKSVAVYLQRMLAECACSYLSDGCQLIAKKWRIEKKRETILRVIVID